MITLYQEFRYGLRRLAHNPGFTIFSVLVLGLSIGISTAIFTVVDSTMLGRLPVKDPQQLIIMYSTARSLGGIPGKGFNYPGYSDENSSVSFSYRSFEYFRAGSHVLSTVFAFAPLGRAWFDSGKVVIGVNREAILATGEMVSGGYFPGLGIRATPGRLITEEDEKGDSPVAVINYDLWSQRFGRSPTVVGETLVVKSIVYTIVGVAPRGFYGLVEGKRADFWVPLSTKRPSLTCWGAPARSLEEPYWRGLAVMGRLRPGIARAKARAEIEQLYRRSITDVADLPLKPEIPSLELLPGSHGLSVVGKQLSESLIILMAMAGMLLLIGCVNVSTVLLARAVARKKETAICLALGASRVRLIRPLVIESAILACLGAALGLLLTTWGSRMLALSLADIVQSEGLSVPEPHLDATILIFAAGITTFAGILYCFAPAWWASRVDIVLALKNDSITPVAGVPERLWLTKPLLVGQVILSLVLLVGAGLFLRTLRNLLHEDLGFDPGHLLVFSVSPMNNSSMSPTQIDQYLRLQEQLEALPGVQAVTSSLLPPLSSGGAIVPVSIMSQGNVSPQPKIVRFNFVGPGFFKTMRMALLAGRDVERRDDRTSSKIVVADETFVKRILSNMDPLGQQFRIWSEVMLVGVVKNAKQWALREEAQPTIYLPYTQMPGFGDFKGIYFEIRTLGNPVASVSAVRNVIRQVSPDLALGDLGTETQWINQSLAQERIFMQIGSIFGLLALFLVSIGLGGNLSYSVTTRTHEIGIRMAIGAKGGQILWMVLQQNLVLLAFGIIIGVPAAIGASRLIAHQLYGVEPTDLATFGATTLILTFVVLIASFVPARRAYRLDPARALRHE